MQSAHAQAALLASNLQFLIRYLHDDVTAMSELTRAQGANPNALPGSGGALALKAIAQKQGNVE